MHLFYCVSMAQTADSGYYHQVWKKISADSGNTVAEAIDGAKKAQEEKFIYITEVHTPVHHHFTYF